MVDVQDHLMAALRTLDRERPHTVLAHIRQVHRFDRVVQAHRCQRSTPENEKDPRKSEGQSLRVSVMRANPLNANSKGAVTDGGAARSGSWCESGPLSPPAARIRPVPPMPGGSANRHAAAANDRRRHYSQL